MLGVSQMLLSLVLATTLLICSIAAAPEPNTIGFKFRKVNPQAQATSSLRRKRQDGAVSIEINNFAILYMINVTIGTPPQPFGLQLDTGSSDLWIATANSNICSYGDNYCTYGAYNPDASTTYRQNDPDDLFGEFLISYVDGTVIRGFYFNDTLNLDGYSITGATMAAATNASRGLGIMGIGFTENESSNDPTRMQAGLGPNFTYPSILDNMVSQGYIKSRSYALWLDDLNDDVGIILFGGVDTEKYLGSLVSLPIQNDADSGSRTSFTVAWTGLTIDTGASGSTPLDFSPSEPQPAILDSGTTLTYLPDALVDRIFNGLGVTSDLYAGNTLPCTIIANNVSFTYTFGGDGGARITVPLSELLLPLFDYYDQPYTGTNDSSDPQLCQFAIDKAGEDPLLFGDSFLRSTYVVYDLDNYQIALAQTNFRASTGEDGNEVTVISSTNGIPDAISTAHRVSVTQTFTGIPLGTQQATTLPTDSMLYGTSTISRSATINLSTIGTVPPSATESAASETSRSGSATRSTNPSSATGSPSGNQASATNSVASLDVGINRPACLAIIILVAYANIAGTI